MLDKPEVEQFLKTPQWKDQVLKYLFFIQAGDFKRNTFNTEVPPDMLKEVEKIQLEEVQQVIHTYRIMLAMAKLSYQEGKTDHAIAALDEANAFLFGLIAIMKLRDWKVPQLNLAIDQFMRIEHDFIDTVKELSRQGLTRNQANSNLRMGRRMKSITLWPRWINELLTDPPAPSTMNGHIRPLSQRPSLTRRASS
ncbi:MAG: hypothetical protein ACRCZE_02995 [Candidatus Altimarinota bacterium]